MVFEGDEVCWGGIFCWRNLERFCLWSHHHCSYGQTETRAGFSALNRSRNHLDELANDRLKWNYGGQNTCGRNFENRNSWAVLACGATTRDGMTKRRLPLDSARQIGLETTLLDFLIVGWTGCTEGRIDLAEFWELGFLSERSTLLLMRLCRTSHCHGIPILMWHPIMMGCPIMIHGISIIIWLDYEVLPYNFWV